MAKSTRQNKKRNRKIVPLGELDISALAKSTDEGSPLACALIAGAYMENALGCLLEKNLIDDKDGIAKDLLNNAISNLSTTSGRARVSYSLGLVDKETYDGIICVNDIRNAFAHSHKTLDFDSQRIKDLCNKLHQPKLFRCGKPATDEETRRFYSDDRRKLVACAFATFLAINAAVSVSGRPSTLPSLPHTCWIDDKEKLLVPKIIK